MTREGLRGRLSVHLHSALMVGGHSSPSAYVDATTARKRGDVPYLPASTLRGALREACERLYNARRNDPRFAYGTLDVSPLAELFGAPGPDRPGVTAGTENALSSSTSGRVGSLQVGDAEPASHERHTSIRPGVGIDRKTGAVAPEVFYQREVFDAPGVELQAAVHADVSDVARQLFVDALQLVDGIGNSRTRGLGAVSVELLSDTATEQPGATLTVPKRGTASGTALVFVRPSEPLLLGVMPGTGNMRRSQSFLPGSTLRGALAQAVLDSGTSPDDPAFQRVFVAAESALSFSDLYPRRRATTAFIPLPASRSLFKCRYEDDAKHRSKHTRVDVLVRTALARPFVERGVGWTPPTCSVCDAVLRRVDDGVHPRFDVRRRVVTRLARDHATGSAIPGMLYSTEQLEPENVEMVGTVSRLDDEARALLARAERATIRVGGGRSRGLGRVEVEIGDRDSGVQGRAERFAAAIRPLIEASTALGGETFSPNSLLPVLARTDLALDPITADETLRRHIYGDAATARTLMAMQTSGVRSGWDQGHSSRPAGPRPLRGVVAAGSAWLFASDPSARPNFERLADIEAQGIGGDERLLGMGFVAFFAHVFLEGASK